MIKAFAGLRPTVSPVKPPAGSLFWPEGASPAIRSSPGSESLIAARPDLPVELKVNIPVSELQEMYRQAGIFWHFCGLLQTEPALVEHFGMTTVEAMQNGCVPVVFDGGGQREIVEEGRSGFRFCRESANSSKRRSA